MRAGRLGATAASSTVSAAWVPTPHESKELAVVAGRISLKVVARIGLIKGFVAERKIGNDVVFQRTCKRRPVEK